jgi:predicted nucleic-acid-binding Zn-ribbon protein
VSDPRTGGERVEKTISEKAAVLEKLCPGTYFDRAELELADATGSFQFVTPSRRGESLRVVVDLKLLNMTVAQWFDAEIEARGGDAVRDTYYRVRCRRCGIVQIGRANYIKQMCSPDSTWYCPRCGLHEAEFDDDRYEELFTEKAAETQE